MKQQVAFEYEGRSYTVEVERSGDTLVIESEGQRYEVTLSGAVRPRSGPSPAPAAEQASIAAAASSPASPPSAATPAAAPRPAGGAAPGDVVAPMTGTLREIRTSVGASVTEGQVLFVMEAMKMDLEIPVAIAGTVSEIAVTAGDSVVEAQILARVAG